ncbi:MAG: hypothetical protein ACI93R_003172 [Flavobacteriales bacterium]|jgi:hypothetical protein
MSIDTREEVIGQVWYKEWGAWLVFTPLIVVVLVSLTFATIAFKYSDDVVVGEYYRVGKLINEEFGPEQTAEDFNITGTLTLSIESEEILLTLYANDALAIDPTLQLDINLSHPSSSELDRSTKLIRVSGGRYRADLSVPSATRWYIELRAISKDSERYWVLKREISIRDTVTEDGLLIFSL